MDGRPHPPEYAAHTWQGFSTGRWEGNVLVVRHDASQGRLDPAQRPGAQRRGHDDRALHPPRQLLTHIYMIEDPCYLTEPLIKTNGFQLTLKSTMAPYPCKPVVEVPRPRRRAAPSARDRTRISTSTRRSTTCRSRRTRGGAETALPEFDGRSARQRGAARGGSSCRSCRAADQGARPQSADDDIRRSTRSTCRATSGCSLAAGSTPRSRSATRACWSSTR